MGFGPECPILSPSAGVGGGFEHDRRHGSNQPALPTLPVPYLPPIQGWVGNDMDTYADDLAALVEALYKTASNPGGLPIEVFDDIRRNV